MHVLVFDITFLTSVEDSIIFFERNNQLLKTFKKIILSKTSLYYISKLLIISSK